MWFVAWGNKNRRDNNHTENITPSNRHVCFLFFSYFVSFWFDQLQYLLIILCQISDLSSAMFYLIYGMAINYLSVNNVTLRDTENPSILSCCYLLLASWDIIYWRLIGLTTQGTEVIGWRVNCCWQGLVTPLFDSCVRSIIFWGGITLWIDSTVVLSRQNRQTVLFVGCRDKGIITRVWTCHIL